MQLSTLARLCFTFSVTLADGAPVAVPVPAEPTVKLPTPHSHLGGSEPVSCQRLDACLAKSGGGDQGKSTSALKTCIQSFCQELHNDNAMDMSKSRKSLCDDKGKKVWDILAKAKEPVKLNAHKASLVALRSSRPDIYEKVLQVLFAQSSAVGAKACRMTPVPAKTTVKLPIPHGHPEGPQSHGAVKQSAPNVATKPIVKTPVPVKTTVKLPTPHGHPEAGLISRSAPKVDSKPVDKTPVPAKTTVKLPTPHGHPEGPKSAEPMSCKKLDSCLEEAGKEREFKSCIQSFCDELYTEKDLNKTDTRSALCDEKGKEAWDIISKVGIKQNNAKKTSLVALWSQHPAAYEAVVQALFAQSSTVVRMAKACHHGDRAVAPHLTASQSSK